MSSIFEKIESDITRARKLKLNASRDFLTYLKDGIQKVAKEKKVSVTDEMCIGVLNSEIKKSQEARTIAIKQNETKLLIRSDSEIKHWQSYLPKQLIDEEINGVVDKLIKEVNATSIKQMGSVMGAFKTQFLGKADMAKVSGVVKEKLSALK